MRTRRVLLSADGLAALRAAASGDAAGGPRDIEGQGVNGVWDSVDPSAPAVTARRPPCERR